jgi:hypothetical protein
MTREDIIRMAREAGLDIDSWEPLYEGGLTGFGVYECTHEELERFAALVASAEREACAKACEDKAERYAERAAKPEHERDINRDTARIAQQTCFHLADHIRARAKE